MQHSLINHIILLFCCIGCVEIISIANFRSKTIAILKLVNKVTRIIKSYRISDHWKEKVIPFYALRMLRISISMFFVFVLLILIVLLPYSINNNYINFIFSYVTIIESTIIIFLYFKIKYFLFHG